MTSHNSSLEDSFREAVAIGDQARIKKLLIQGIDVNQPIVMKNDPATPLMMAVDTGNLAIIQLLLEHGADINQKAGNDTALVRAVVNDNVETVRLLLEHSADPNILFTYELEGGFWIPPTTSLSFAVIHGKTEIVRLLLEHDADVNFRGDHGTELLEVVETAIHNYKLPDYDREVETLLRQYGARLYNPLSDDDIQRILGLLRQGKELICDVCQECYSYALDKTGKQWHLWCPSACVDVYAPIEAS